MNTYPVYLNGALEVTGETVDVLNPSTGEVCAKMSQTDRSRVRQAIADAHKAFPSWRGVTPKQRGDYLFKIASELEKRAEEIARLITLENGKPLAQSQGEVAMTLDHLRWFGEEAKRAYGRVIPNWVGAKRHLVIKTPIGVVGAIAPWNFPLVLGVRKAAPALAAGCPVVLKPARQTPLSSAAFAECVHAAGLPAGVFQLVQGKASDIGSEFLENPLCRKISFTGSTEVGSKLIAGAAAQIKPLSLELGGQAPCLVFAEADLDKALEGVMMAKFRNTGQSCIAANRIYVERPIYEEFLEKFTVRVRELKVGDGFEPGVNIGPLIDKIALDKAMEHIEDALQKGARLLAGGNRIPGRPGFFLAPTILAEAPENALCTCEETFAPIAPVAAFSDEADAIFKANKTPFGLSAYVFTRDLPRAFRLMESIEAGMIGLNDGVPTATQAPFGGVKMSGWGRELGAEGLEAFLDTKHISLGI